MKISIALICDNGYVIPTMAVLQSLRETRSPETEIEVTIVSADLSENSKSLFLPFSGPGFQVRFIDADVKGLVELHRPKKGDMCVASPAALLKFSLPVLLPELEKVLYLDGDILVRSDLSPLWNTNLEGATIGAVQDSGCIYSQNPRIKKYPHYFNSGVMLLDLAKMRREGMTKRLIEAKKAEQDKSKNRLMDQNIFNAFFHNDVKLLPIQWNLLLVNLKRAEAKWTFSDIERMYGARFTNFEQMTAQASIWHFSSKDKPWKINDVLKGEVWREVYGRIPNAPCLQCASPDKTHPAYRNAPPRNGTILGRWLWEHGITRFLLPIVNLYRGLRFLASGTLLKDFRKNTEELERARKDIERLQKDIQRLQKSA